MPLIYEPKEEVKKRELEEQEKFFKDFMNNEIRSTPIQVSTEDISDGKKIIREMSLDQLHILEQMALKMCTDPEIFATLPLSFYGKILKVWIKRVTLKLKKILSLIKFWK